MQKRQGFNLLSVVLVVAIILVLGSATFFWLDPINQISRARDSKRRHDMTTLNLALTKYSNDHDGSLPLSGTVTTDKKVLCSSANSLTCSGDTQTCLAISDTDFTNKYLAVLPVDPAKTSVTDTGYYFSKDSNGYLIIGPCASTTMAIKSKIKP